MRYLKSLYSLVILGILFITHLLRYPFRKEISSSKFLARFLDDNINVITREEEEILYNSAECISCNICSVGKYGIELVDGDEMCSRVLRDPTYYKYVKAQFFYGDCPYNIDLKRISKLM
ncbi:MAG: hypothetical protein N2746_08675 [Deltaproteobacteria bacterium]|nr:hypothetical protein [Deltaproteobacteria bacterium]